MRHTRHGYWLEEAGPVEPHAPLSGPATADVLVIGGGFTGMWAAWSVLERAPGARVVLLEAETCGAGPSGRNGGFVESYWQYLPDLRARFGDEAALALCRASGESVAAIGAWCEAQDVDAWYRQAGYLSVSTAPAQDAVGRDAVAACAALGAEGLVVPLSAEEVRARCASPVFRAGVLMADGATVQPARLARGLRARLAERGVAIHEGARVSRLRPLAGGGVLAHAGGGEVRARAAVLAAGGAIAALGPVRRRLAVASSHIVLTEPVPDVLEELGWTGGEAITDGRRFLHYTRTTRDGRIAFGWAGGHMAYGARLRGRIEVDPAVAAQARRDLARFFPALAGREVTHAWGGPIDVSPTHLPVIGTLPGAPVHYAAGYTGNGVGPTHLAGRVLAALALDAREDLTRLPLVEQATPFVPGEPLRWLGGEAIRAAILRKERLEEAGRRPDPLTAAVCTLPIRLGVHLGR